MASYCEKIDVVVISDTDSDSGSGSASSSASAKVQALFVDSDDELQKLKKYDNSCQNARKKTKEAMTLKKAEAAKEKAAKTKETLEQEAKKAVAKANAVKSKAKANAVKSKTAKKKKTKSATVKFSIGMKVNACWQGDGPEKGQWFDGTIVSVNNDAETAHVKFDDGDEDDSLAWRHISCLENLHG